MALEKGSCPLRRGAEMLTLAASLHGLRMGTHPVTADNNQTMELSYCFKNEARCMLPLFDKYMFKKHMKHLSLNKLEQSFVRAPLSFCFLEHFY